MVRSMMLIVAVLTAQGCGRQAAPVAVFAPVANIQTLAQEPPGAQDVIAARKDVKDGDDVVLVGRVGGDLEPILKGRAAFTLADRSLKPCNEREGDACPTPWDYCCEPPDAIKNGTVLVKLVDDVGQTLPVDLRERLGLRELKTVVVQGQAKRDEAGNFTLVAKGVFIRP